MYLEDFVWQIDYHLKGVKFLNEAIIDTLSENYQLFKDDDEKNDYYKMKAFLHASEAEIEYIENLKQKFSKIINNLYENRKNKLIDEAEGG